MEEYFRFRFIVEIISLSLTGLIISGYMLYCLTLFIKTKIKDKKRR